MGIFGLRNMSFLKFETQLVKSDAALFYYRDLAQVVFFNIFQHLNLRLRLLFIFFSALSEMRVLERNVL